MARIGRSEDLQEIDLDKFFVRGPASSQVGGRGRQREADEVFQMEGDDLFDEDYVDDSISGQSKRK